MTRSGPGNYQGRVLIIAGSDSGGGAGIQADIKTVTALGGYAATAITAITVQNTLGVTGIQEVPVDILRGQIDAVLDDIGADAVKIGMLHRSEVIAAVADALAEKGADIPLVLDPVMVAKGGHALLEEAAVAALKDRLIPRATVLTPNLPEAEVLGGKLVQGPDDMAAVAEAVLTLGSAAVFLKGGHLTGETLVDLLIDEDGVTRFTHKRIDTPHTHGTGCTTASAIACGLAQGMGLKEAVVRARAYVRRAIETAPGLGQGHGPLNHGHTVCKFPD